jgi:DNA-binding PadR family transcriptional regulator
MRRKKGELVPLEHEILAVFVVLRRRRIEETHGYELARHVQEMSGSKTLMAYGTLYRALNRLRAMGLLDSRWEDPASVEAQGRPPRRLYSLTATGTAAATSLPSRAAAAVRRRSRLAQA